MKYLVCANCKKTFPDKNRKRNKFCCNKCHREGISGKNNPNYREPKKYFCITCDKKVSRKASYCRKCWGVSVRGENNAKYTNGKTITSLGYIKVRRREHPFSDSEGRVYEHRLVMEKILGRYLTKKEVIHHINKDRKDNRSKNLKLFKNKEEHNQFHREEKKNAV